MTTAQVRLSGFEQFYELLGDVADRASDLRPVWPAIGEVWAERERDVFDTQGRGRWAPLRASTLAEKRKLGESSKPLVAHGSLLRALTLPEPRYADKDEAVFGPPKGSGVELYGKWHVKGSKNLPQRNPVPRFSVAERRRVVERIRVFVVDGTR